jgi:hypothetical protein
MNLEKLKEPFAPSDVSWRIGQAGKTRDGKIWAKVLAYIDNRNIQERLDEVVGPANWKNEYAKGPEGGVLCGLSIKVDGEWVTKWDGAENSDIEPIKGGLSDSMKRAAVQWSIGRYLYELGETWAEIVEKGVPGAHYANCKVKVDGKDDWATFYWLPPRGVLPGQEPPRNQPKTEAPQASPAHKKALEKIAAAVRNRDVNDIARIMNVAEDAHAQGKLTETERVAITLECTMALKKIKALENEPAEAAA